MHQHAKEQPVKTAPEKGLTPLERKHLEETKQRHHSALKQLSQI